MLNKFSLALLILALGHSTHAQVARFGKCPEVKLMTEFNFPAYTGIWFEYAKYPFVFELGQKCNLAKYGAIDDSTISVVNEAFGVFTEWPARIEGYAKVLGPGRLAVVFGDTNSQAEQENYTVLGTDYETFAMVFSCSEVGLIRTEYAWILTRDRIPSEETIAKAKKVMQDNGISEDSLVYTTQEGCPKPGQFYG